MFKGMNKVKVLIANLADYIDGIDIDSVDCKANVEYCLEIADKIEDEADLYRWRSLNTDPDNLPCDNGKLILVARKQYVMIKGNPVLAMAYGTLDYKSFFAERNVVKFDGWKYIDEFEDPWAFAQIIEGENG